MTCTKMTTACACAAPAGLDLPRGDRARVVVASTTSHTLSAVRRAAAPLGEVQDVAGPACQVMTDDLDGLLDALDHALTGPEKDEARLMTVTDMSDPALVATALTAPTLAVLCARRRERPLGLALRDETRFSSAYQPIVDLTSGLAVGYEALLRGSLDGQPVMPDEMFAAAEEAGWLHVLDRIGRETAIRGAAGWLGDADLFVNFNPTSIYRPEVCLATTMRAVGDAGLRLDQLVFEIVESHHVDAMDHLLGVLRHYREMGCRVAMDDMGAGYASLNSLAAIQPDVVKLDKALVQGLPDPAATAVIRSIVAMAHDLGATVIAECVETEDQALAARDLGIDWAQGWFFARPGTPPLQLDLPRLPAAPSRTARAAVGGRQLDRLIRRAADATTTGITVADARQDDMPLVYVNDAFTRISGYVVDEVLGRNCRFLQDETTDPAEVGRLRDAVRAGEPVQSRLVNVRRDGTRWWNDLSLTPVVDPDGTVTHYVGIQQDVTDLVLARQRIEHMAGHDPLTGLANRANLMSFLDRSLATAARSGAIVAVTFLDLDGFKAVNDAHGHAVGDEVLACVAARLSTIVRHGEMVARIGGDEFVLVQVAETADVATATRRAADDIAAALSEPIEVEGLQLHVRASAGVATSSDATQAGALLDAADAAMYATKHAGRPAVGA